MEINAAWKGLRKGRAESNFLLSCGDEKFFAAASVLVGRILIRRAAGNACMRLPPQRPRSPAREGQSLPRAVTRR